MKVKRVFAFIIAIALTVFSPYCSAFADNNGYDFSEWSDPEDAYQELTKLYIKDDESIAKAEELFSILPADYKDVATYKQTFDFYKPYVGIYRSNNGDQTTFRIRYVKQEGKFAAIIGVGRNAAGGYEGILSTHNCLLVECITVNLLL